MCDLMSTQLLGNKAVHVPKDAIFHYMLMSSIASHRSFLSVKNWLYSINE